MWNVGGDRRGAHSVVIGKHEGRRNLEDLGRRRWENNIKKGFQETEWGLDLAQGKQKC